MSRKDWQLHVASDCVSTSESARDNELMEHAACKPEAIRSSTGKSTGNFHESWSHEQREIQRIVEGTLGNVAMSSMLKAPTVGALSMLASI